MILVLMSISINNIYMLTEKHNKIIIVCSGASAKGFMPPDNVTVIAVNNTISWLSRADYFFTLDPGGYNRAAIANQREGVEYCVAFPDHFPNCTMFERIADYSDNGVQFDGRDRVVTGAKKTLSEVQGMIHTGNSAYGALGMAYLKGFDKLVFIGLDGGGPYCDGTPHYREVFPHLNELFASTIQQVGGRVVNASINSSVDCFPRMTHKEALAWLMEI